MTCRLVCLLAGFLTISNPCWCEDRSGATTLLLQMRPELAESFGNLMLSAGQERKGPLPSDFEIAEITKALGSRELGLEFLSKTYQELQDSGDLQLAAFVGRSWIQAQEKSGQSDPEFRVDRFRDDAVLPVDMFCEVHYPSARYSAAYLDVTAAASRARALLSLPDLGVESRREKIRSWLDRVNWITGGAANEPLAGRTVKIQGRLTVNGRPSPFTRIALAGPTQDSIGGGGYRFYLSGFDSPPTKSLLPFPMMRTARTDMEGKFELEVQAQRPYELIVFIYSASSAPISDAVVTSDAESILRKSLISGFELADDAAQAFVDVGTVEVKLSHKSVDRIQRPAVFSRPVVDLPVYAKGAPVVVPVIIQNVGSVPLEISNAKTDCSCSDLQDPHRKKIEFPVTLAPDSSVVWSMEIKTNGMRMGNQAKSYLLQTNDPLNPVVRRQVTFSISESVRLNPPFLRIEPSHGKGDQSRLTATVSLATDVGGELPRIDSATANRGLVETEISEDAHSFQVFVDAKVLKERGVLADIIMVRTSDGTTLELPVQCRLQPGLDVHPTRFAFRGVRRDSLVQRKFIVPKATVVKSVKSASGQFEVVSFAQEGKVVSFEIKLLHDVGVDQLLIELADQQSVPISVGWGESQAQ